MSDFIPNQTLIPNMVIDNMAELTSAEFRVAIAVWRHHNTFARQNDLPPTISELIRVTGVDGIAIKEALQTLKTRHILPQYFRVHQLSYVPNNRTSISPKTRVQILSSSDSCAFCGSGEDLTIDHIKPVVLGGTNEISNLQVLCRSCNSRKGAKYRVVEELFIE